MIMRITLYYICYNADDDDTEVEEEEEEEEEDECGTFIARSM